MRRILVDASVLMEIMFGRAKLSQCQSEMRGLDQEFYASSLTVHILYYFAEQTKYDKTVVAEIVAVCGILPVDPRMVRLAQKRYQGKDFEDCLQAACAELSDCDEILTLDKNFETVSSTRLQVRVI